MYEWIQLTSNCSWNPVTFFPGTILCILLTRALKLEARIAVSPHVVSSSIASCINTY